jgi:hypothetical protein
MPKTLPAMHRGETAMAAKNSQGTGNKVARRQFFFGGTRNAARSTRILSRGCAGQERLPARSNAMNEGFLGTAAPRYADLVVLLEFGMGVALLIGAALARTRRFRLHAWCQSAIVLLNLVVVVLLMVPSIVLDSPNGVPEISIR